MADYEPPSFSLGLDFDLDSQPQIPVRNDRGLGAEARPSSSGPTFCLIEDDDDFETPTVDRDPQASGPPRTLKRLRRGSASTSESAARKPLCVELGCNVDDDIEEFSSQEDRSGANRHSSIHYHSGCSSSKIPLSGNRVLTTKSVSQWKTTKRKQTSDTITFECLETSSNKLMFPKLTVSPVRRFQLLDDSDSDSDIPSVSEVTNRETNKIDSAFKGKEASSLRCPSTSGHNKTKASQTQDLWKDFYTEKNFHIPTPALDAVCDEYFSCLKNKNEALTQRHWNFSNDNENCYQPSNVTNNDEHNCELGGPALPANRYFFNDDPRIQKLVRTRLPYFFPLGAMNNGGTQHPVSSDIDYMSQFSHGEGSKKRAAGKTNARTSCTKGQKNSRLSNAENASEGSGCWVNPKSSMSTPKDAGKRRVHAVGQSSGHWYTNPDGRRVYVSKNGQELTGQIAYRHYKKESGAGFKKLRKKKAPAKKQTAAKKPAAKKKK
ncbi:hypothetical protein NMG60_11002224 [Bertholletia excelsa]